MSVIVARVLIFAAIGVIVAQGPDPSCGAIGLAVALYMLGYLISLIGGIFQLVLLYRCWNSIQELPARSTPGKAVGFLFIPLFNLYWMFVAFYGLAQDMRLYCAQRAIPCAANPTFALITLILLLLPCVQIAIVVMFPMMLNQFKNTGAAISIWHRGVGF